MVNIIWTIPYGSYDMLTVNNHQKANFNLEKVATK